MLKSRQAATEQHPKDATDPAPQQHQEQRHLNQEATPRHSGGAPDITPVGTTHLSAAHPNQEHQYDTAQQPTPDHPDSANQSKEVIQRLMVNAQVMGKLIGRGGNRMHTICDKHQVRVEIQQEPPKSTTLGSMIEQQIIIKGTSSNVMNAMNELASRTMSKFHPQCAKQQCRFRHTTSPKNDQGCRTSRPQHNGAAVHIRREEPQRKYQ